jgi:hypothetical protein
MHKHGVTQRPVHRLLRSRECFVGFGIDHNFSKKYSWALGVDCFCQIVTECAVIWLNVAAVNVPCGISSVMDEKYS